MRRPGAPVESQELLSRSVRWAEIAETGGVSVVGPAESLAARFEATARFVVHGGTVYAALGDQGMRVLDAAALMAAWRTGGGPDGPGPEPSAADFAAAAEMLHARALAEYRRRSEEQAVADAARAAIGHADAEERAAGTSARRAALERELAALDEIAPPAESARRPWWRVATDPTP